MGCLIISCPSHSQSFLDDVLDIFKIPLNKKAVQRDSSRYPASLVLAPVVAYEPATSWGAGVGAKILFKPGRSGQETRTSNMPISALYTFNNQIILSSGYTIFFNQEKWSLRGNLAFSKFPQNFFGIGNLSLEEDEEIYDFTNYLIEPILLKKYSVNFSSAAASATTSSTRLTWSRKAGWFRNNRQAMKALPPPGWRLSPCGTAAIMYSMHRMVSLPK
ncbi:MAG: hypothetical protein HC880_13940 [Bacteroidia bacterium]|nr:hypothetical protein [Bacteroidia bacterium]